MKIKKIKSILLFVSLFGLQSCSSNEKASERTEKGVSVDDKYRISSDRQTLAEIRKDIPPEVQKNNDELAYIFQLMSEMRYSPSEVREKFNSAVRKKRDVFQKDMQRKRDEYNKAEKSQRETFTQDQNQQRNEFKRERADRDRTKDFFAKLEEQRKTFYSENRQKRDEFESDVRVQRKDFEDYIREKNNEFNQEHRAYTKRFDEAKKDKKDRKEAQSGVTPSSAFLQQRDQVTKSSSAYGITTEELERAFQEASGKPYQNLEPGK